MLNLNLTQTDLNEPLRGLTNVDILMFLPDKNISFPSDAITLNQQPLQYTTNPQSIIEFSSLPQANIATFENNSWILDGSFVPPSEQYGGGGDSYTGYISNEMTNDNGNYTTNPSMLIRLSTSADITNISLFFAGGLDTSYPKLVKIETYDQSNSVIAEHTYDPLQFNGLPLMVVTVGDTAVKSLRFTFYGTLAPHRRTRLNKIMFGKAELVNPYYLQSWKIDDKASLVADSIPTKTLEYSIIDYDGDYDIDNPGNKIPKVYTDVMVLFTFSMEKDGLWKFAPTKIFNLIDISTTSEGVVTFSCGSILDILTETYDHDIYDGPKTIDTIMNQLLSFSGIATDQYSLEYEFANYLINVPIPEAPVREIIQRLAFSCGATLTVNDDNKIVFSKKNIIPNSNTSKFMFNQPVPFTAAGVLLNEPNAEALSNTTNIAMATYDATIEEETSELGTTNVSTIRPTRISFPAITGGIGFDAQEIEDQHASLRGISEVYSQHAVIELAWSSEATPPIVVKVYGQKVNTTQTIPKTTTVDTLLLDSGLASNIPENLIRPTNPNPNTFYYTDWYGAKFKYNCKTRNEYLVKAGDIILFETLYSNGAPTRVGYVLRNSYSSSNDSGEMEVITIGNS